MKKICSFSDDNNYNLRSGTHPSRRILHTTHYGTEPIKDLGAKIWELVPQNIKEANSLFSFKIKVEKWIPKKCRCRLCKTTYIGQGGFVQFFAKPFNA